MRHTVFSLEGSYLPLVTSEGDAMVIGQAALRSPTFDERLSALLEELQERGCTVWLEGMTLRFDVPEDQLAWVQMGGVNEVLGRYKDVVLWLPEELPGSLPESLEVGFQSVWPRAPTAAPLRTLRPRSRRGQRFGQRLPSKERA
jgi:hypothetical protein